MPSSGTGHATNVTNFETLISFCVGDGAKYNPSNNVLKVANLQTQYTAADAVMDSCKKTETAFHNATDVRRDNFAGIKPFSTRIVNAFAASDVPKSIVDGAKTINHKIQGHRATPLPATKKAEDGTDLPANTISSSQQGYDDFVEHISSLIELIGSQPTYMPNEEDLKIGSLQTYLSTLKTSNKLVKDTFTNWSNSRIERDTLLYGDKIGLVDVTLGVKNYIKSAFGASSPQFKQVSGLEFSRPRT